MNIFAGVVHNLDSGVHQNQFTESGKLTLVVKDSFTLLTLPNEQRMREAPIKFEFIPKRKSAASFPLKCSAI